MGATNVNALVTRVGIGGNVKGVRFGTIQGIAKAAQNDTITITNANIVSQAILFAADGSAETTTVTGSSNVITCTAATTTKVLSGLVIYSV